MEVTHEQLQLLALAEEVERLQVVVSDERAARDALRRRFFKLSAPAAAAALQVRAAKELRSLEASPLEYSNMSGGTESAEAHVVSPRRETVVERAQRAAHPELEHSTPNSAGHPAKQSRRPFSLWGFITGADKVAEQDEWA